MFIERFRRIAGILSVIAFISMVSPGQSAEDSPAAIRPSRHAEPIVGAYYYPWYQHTSQWRRVMRQHLKVPQEPKAGLHRSDDPKVVAEHIAQSIRGGISF